MLALLVIFSYLIGSIPTGYIIVKKKFNKDIREFGSGNIGATNVGRIAGKKLSKITAICDMLKAIVPVLVTYLFLYLGLLKSNKSIALALVAVAAILGHNYTIFLKFKLTLIIYSIKKTDRKLSAYFISETKKDSH